MNPLGIELNVSCNHCGQAGHVSIIPQCKEQSFYQTGIQMSDSWRPIIEPSEKLPSGFLLKFLCPPCAKKRRSEIKQRLTQLIDSEEQ